LSHVVAAPDRVVKLGEGGGVGGAGHVEALGRVVDSVSALQPHDGVLLAGQGSGVLAAKHVLKEQAALGSAMQNLGKGSAKISQAKLLK
jgi:hypothetical protein